ncbi:MAG TPA: SAM-dependent methyltransferase [Ktedonobacterales bacterium]|jgi:methyltransferase (TIGR00027 family)
MTDGTRPVALTAQLTAKARAIESQRADALFHDPWAELFAGRAGDAWLARQQSGYPGLPLILRTRFFDDFFAERMGDVSLRQVVLLAAGYDTRAYRLAWPKGTRLYELDQPMVLARKETLLQRAGATLLCERIAIGADLAADWSAPLLASGFTLERPSIWLLEGLLMYLTRIEAETAINSITRLTSQNSWMGMDLLNSATLTSPWTQERIARLAQRGMPWQFGIDDPRAWLAPLQWDAKVTTPEEVGLRLGRWPYPPRPPMAEALDLPNAFFVIAKRNERAE